MAVPGWGPLIVVGLAAALVVVIAAVFLVMTFNRKSNKRDND